MADKFKTSQTRITDQHGIVWTEQYSVYNANIGGLIRASVHYDNGGYKVQVGGMRLKNPSKTAEEGMALAVKLVQKQLSFLFK